MPLRRSTRARTALSYVVVALASAGIAIPTIFRVSSPEVRTDITLHWEMAPRIVESGHALSYSLWYPIVYLFSGGFYSVDSARIASVAALSVLLVAKALIVLWIARRAVPAGYAVAIAVVSVLVMCLVNPATPTDVVLGQISPNIWHNSTNILVAPFAFAAFALGIGFLSAPTGRRAALLSVVLVVMVLAKPSFALALLPVLGIATLIAFGREGLTWRTRIGLIAAVFVPVTLVLIYQYVSVWVDGVVRSDFSLTVDPLAGWMSHSDNPLLSLLLSFAGPVAAVFAMSPEARRSVPVVIAWATTALAVAQFALFAEVSSAGEVSSSMNWSWGAHTASSILFVVSLIELVRTARDKDATRARKVALVIALVVMAAHVASGIFYVTGIGTPEWRY